MKEKHERGQRKRSREREAIDWRFKASKRLSELRADAIPGQSVDPRQAIGHSGVRFLMPISEIDSQRFDSSLLGVVFIFYFADPVP